MSNLGKIVYLTEAQLATLVSDGSITVDDKTVTYSENDIYMTPSQPSIPAGGNTGQSLVKLSGNDYDVGWAMPRVAVPDYTNEIVERTEITGTDIYTATQPCFVHVQLEFTSSRQFVNIAVGSVNVGKYAGWANNGSSMSVSVYLFLNAGDVLTRDTISNNSCFVQVFGLEQLTNNVLPVVSSSDNGKFLRVVNGAWNVASISMASGVNF